VGFKKANPLKWEEFQEHLRSLDITQFGQGEGTSAEGVKSIALGAVHKDGQIFYTPMLREVVVMGGNLEPTFKLYTETLEIIREMYGSSERLKSNVNYYEFQVKAEKEPDSASPLDMMRHITPPGLFRPFEEVLKIGQLGMYTYRFFYTSTPVTESIVKTVPWYDVQFFPGIPNPDRFAIWIICRDISPEVGMGHCRDLDKKVIAYLEEKERELSRRRG
jgi:hypothetical protein